MISSRTAIGRAHHKHTHTHTQTHTHTDTHTHTQHTHNTHTHCLLYGWTASVCDGNSRGRWVCARVGHTKRQQTRPYSAAPFSLVSVCNYFHSECSQTELLRKLILFCTHARTHTHAHTHTHTHTYARTHAHSLFPFLFLHPSTALPQGVVCALQSLLRSPGAHCRL